MLKQKEEEITKATALFKETHEKGKRDQNQARVELVKLYGTVRKQDMVLQNVESGFYSQSTKRLKFNESERPLVPEVSDLPM